MSMQDEAPLLDFLLSEGSEAGGITHGSEFYPLRRQPWRRRRLLSASEDGLRFDSAHAETPAPPADLLAQFLRLADAETKELFSFAEEWGPIGFCQHGQPAMHREYDFLPAPDTTGYCAPVAVEPIVWWRSLALKLRAIGEVAANLHADEVPDLSLWTDAGWLLSGAYREGEFVRYPHSTTMQQMRDLVAGGLTQWMALCGVRPLMSWRGGVVKVEMGVRYGTPLLATIVSDLSMRVANATAMYKCEWCKRWFPASEKKNRKFCPEHVGKRKNLWQKKQSATASQNSKRRR